MELVVYLDAATARGVRSGDRRNRRAVTLLRLARDLGITLEPMHPRARRGDLAKVFAVTVADAAAARRAFEALTASGLVEGASVVPSGGPP